jgi:Recombination endonuclease VII
VPQSATTCENPACGRPITPRTYQGGKRQRFCSKRCANATRRRPSVAKLPRPIAVYTNAVDKMRAWKHGMTPEQWQAMWDAQNGRCYLCGEPMTKSERASRGVSRDPRSVVMEHLHGHCADPRKTCAVCRRGLACQRCNVLIGLAGDDPVLLRVIADALEIANTTVRVRVAALPIQDALFTLDHPPRVILTRFY